MTTPSLPPPTDGSADNARPAEPTARLTFGLPEPLRRIIRLAFFAGKRHEQSLWTESDLALAETVLEAEAFAKEVGRG